MNKHLFYLLVIFPFWGYAQYEQLGQTLIGGAADHRMGVNAVNKDGTVIAAASISANGGAGQVQVFRYGGEDGWIQFGQTLEGMNFSYGRFGSDVSLNEEGDILAVAQEYVDWNFSNGRIHVYQYQNDAWVSLGQTVVINAIGTQGYVSVDLSGDGLSLIVRSVGVSAQVYKYNGDSDLWEQSEGNFPSTTDISISKDGNRIALGQGNAAVNGINTGKVQVFQYDGASSWVQLGEDIVGEAVAQESFGNSVSLNADGSVIVVGAPNNDGNGNNAGHVRVFGYDGTSWIQHGEDIEGEAASDNLGTSVSINAQGNIVSTGAPGHDGNGNNAGRVYVYRLNGTSWEPVQHIDGVAAPNGLGGKGTVNLNGDGSVLAAGAPANHGNGLNSGHIRVFQNCGFSSLPAPEVEVSEAVCPGGIVTFTAEETINWYEGADTEAPFFTGMQFETPELDETTSYWIDVTGFTGCTSSRLEIVATVHPIPVLTVENTAGMETCEGTPAMLAAISDNGTISWYESDDAEVPLFTGPEYETPELDETISYWVEAVDMDTGCVSERIEVVVTVIPAPELDVEETEYEVCSGTQAELFAVSEGNVIFWYANEDDNEYLYHGNLFVTGELTGTTTYWAEAYNIATGCASERTEITVTVNAIPDAPTAVTIQYFEEGETLSDLEIEADGEITWYANGELTIVLPESTLLVAGTTYYATQTISGCESEAVGILVEPELGIADTDAKGFTIYPNPTEGIVKIRSKTAIISIEVFNTGRQVVTSVKETKEVNLSGYPGGTYILKIMLENGEVVTKKVIKK